MKITPQMIEIITGDGSGITSDNPIIVRCLFCNGACGYDDSVAHCHPCKKWFPYDYEYGKWYLKCGFRNECGYIAQYVRLMEWIWSWEIWGKEIVIDDEYVWLRCKNVEEQQFMMAEMLGAKDE